MSFRHTWAWGILIYTRYSETEIVLSHLPVESTNEQALKSRVERKFQGPKVCDKWEDIAQRKQTEL